MAPYRITLLDQDGATSTEHLIDFEHDDAAIDHAGAIDHPHDIDVWRGKRRVAHFPAWPSPWPPPWVRGSLRRFAN
jgi:hypothetical protein